MNRIFSTIIIIALIFSLSACTAVYSERKDLEGMIIVEVLGFDSSTKGVRLSLASAATEDEALSFAADGLSVSSAIENIKLSACDGDILSAHADNIIIGRDSAEAGIASCLEYICRSPELRIGLELFVMQNSSAESAVVNTGGNKSGITEVLSRLKSGSDTRSQPYIYSAVEIISRLESTNSALIYALSAAPAAEGDGTTVVPSGYGIAEGDRVIRYIKPELSPAVAILDGKSYVTDYECGEVSFRLENGHAEFTPVFGTDGALEEVQIKVSVSASVVESDPRGSIDSKNVELLENSVLNDIMSIIRIAKNTGCDFLALKDKLYCVSPKEIIQQEKPVSMLLPDLKFTVSVSGTVTHTNDIRE